MNVLLIKRKYPEEDFVWKILLQLVLAVQECHRRKDGAHVLHRDLKPANVFLDSSNNVKLGDFGLARVLMHDTSFAKTFVGTPYYMSPVSVELLHCGISNNNILFLKTHYTAVSMLFTKFKNMQ